MAQDRLKIVAEVLPLLVGTSDPQLRALQVALHLEDALDVEIPPDLLTPEHLGSREAIIDTLEHIDRLA